MTTPGRQKVLSLDALADEVARYRAAGRTVGMCHGCFDVLHAGHLRHFEAARELADILVVTVTPDRFVNKGPHRPVFPEGQRAELVAGLWPVDLVAINLWASAVDTILRVRPTLFIKGQEYEDRAAEVNPAFFAEREAVESVGGKIAFTYEWTSSSSAAIERMRATGE